MKAKIFLISIFFLFFFLVVIDAKSLDRVLKHFQKKTTYLKYKKSGRKMQKIMNQVVANDTREIKEPFTNKQRENFEQLKIKTKKDTKKLIEIFKESNNIPKEREMDQDCNFFFIP